MIWLYMFLAFTGGLFLGALYFGGLWWTVKKVTGEKKGAILFLSLFIRLGFLLTGFYLLLIQGWQYLLAALMGLIVSRIIIFQMIKPERKTGKEVD